MYSCWTALPIRDFLYYISVFNLSLCCAFSVAGWAFDQSKNPEGQRREFETVRLCEL